MTRGERMKMMLNFEQIRRKSSSIRALLKAQGTNAAGSILGVLLVLLLPLAPAAGQTDHAFSGIAGLGNSLVNMSWSNGAPNNLLQRKFDLTLDPSWVNILSTSDQLANVPADAPNAFYRFQVGATNIVTAFGVMLNGPSEVPVTASTATCVGSFSLEGTNLYYHVSYSGLSSSATAAHLHAPSGPTNTAGVMIALPISAGTAGVLTGNLPLTTDQLSNIVTGLAYINIHTTSNPGGEIRSHLVPLHVPVTLDGASETPPVVTTGSASGYLTMLGSQLYYNITYTNLSGPATAMHIHGPAGPGVPAGVLIGLTTPSGTSGTVSGTVTLTPTQLSYLLIGQTYLNIHTTVNGGGEVRGQIWPIQLVASLSGSQESPSVASAGSGTAFITLLGNQLSWTVTFQNLSANATLGHIHGPAWPGVNAGVIVPFSGVPAATSGTITGTATVTSQQIYWLMSGQTYVNIHSTANPGGEIRGQLSPAN